MIKLLIIHSLDFRLASLSPIHTLQNLAGLQVLKFQDPILEFSERPKESKRQPLTASSFPGNPSHWVLPLSTAGLPQLLGAPPAINANQHRFLNSEQPECPHYEISSFSDSASLQRGPEHALGSDNRSRFTLVQPQKEEMSHEATEWSYTENSPEETARHY